MKKILGTLVLFATTITAVHAQEIPEIGETYGRVVGIADIPEISGLQPEVAVLAARPAASAALTPAYIFGDGADVYGASFDLNLYQKHSFQGRVLNIRPDTGGTFSQYRASYGYTWPLQRSNSAMTLMGRYVETEDLHSTIEAFAIYEKRFTGIAGKTMSLTTNVKWMERDFDAGGSEDTVGGGLGMRTVFSSSFILSMDYEFEDDLNNDDTFTISGVFPFRFASRPASIIIGASDNDSITLVARFNF